MCAIENAIVAWAGLAAAVWFFFKRAEKTVAKPGDDWAGTFAAVLNSVFGERGRSWGCFWRSCVASFVTVVVITAIWAALRPEQFAALVRQEDFRQSLISVFPVVTLLSCLPGYATLLATRAFVRRMSAGGRPLRVFCLLIAHAIAAFAVALAALLVFKGAVVASFLYLRPEEAGLIRWTPAEMWAFGCASVFPLSAIPGYWSWGIWFYATFFAPVLTWLYAASGAILRLASIGKQMAGTGRNPPRLLGVVAVVVVSAVYWVPFVLR
jgi:hypothetical protein